MTETIRSWLFGILGAAVLCAVCDALTPKGRVKTVLKFVSGVVMATALISPIADFDFTAYSGFVEEYRQDVSLMTGALEEENLRLSRLIIEDECAAYILDKAQVVGLDIKSAAVTVKWGDGSWYPAEVHITGEETKGGPLADLIESELGVPREMQYWSVEDEG